MFQGFLDYLRDRYGDVETLNQRWGLTYWSHRLSDWADLWTPDGNTTPSYDLAWRRYQAQLTHDYIGWQAELVRGLVPDDQFVTTCVALGQVGLDIAKVGEPLDVVGTNVYYATQDGLELPGDRTSCRPGCTRSSWRGAARPGCTCRPTSPEGPGQQPFLVTETNASSIGGSADNFPSYRGQLRQVVWSLVARGARLVEYWHWHSLHYGAETYWGGILGHSLEPGRIYYELAAVGAELQRRRSCIGDAAGPQRRRRPGVGREPLGDGVHGAAAGRLGTGWATRSPTSGSSPPSTAGCSTPVWRSTSSPRTSCRPTSASWYGAGRCWSSRASTSPTTRTLELLRDYAEAGGHLVLTPRTGYADEEAVVRHEVMPGVLREAAGVQLLGVHQPARRRLRRDRRSSPVVCRCRAPAGPTG